MKTTTLTCKEIRPAIGGHKGCILLAYNEEGHDGQDMDLTDATVLTSASDGLRAQGLVLGGPLQDFRRSSPQSLPTAPVQIKAHDDEGKEHRLTIHALDKYSLSSGSGLYYLAVAEAPADCRWLVGRTLAVVEVDPEALQVMGVVPQAAPAVSPRE